MSRFQTCLVACAVFCCAATASAGVLDGFAGALQSGSTPYQGYDVDLNPTGLAGYIDWAVFAPDSFPTDVGEFSGYAPTAGQYVYAYQAFETGIAPLTLVSVTLSSVSSANNIGSFTGTGVGFEVSGQSPSTSYFFPDPPTSANWDFNPGVAVSMANQGGSTIGLAFSSPFAPIESDGGTVDDGSTAVVVPLASPAPVPEPGTLVFWSFGIVFCAARWIRRRERKAGSSAFGAPAG